MNAVAIILVIVTVVLGIFLWDRYKEQKDYIQALLKRIPVAKEETAGLEPLTMEKISEAIQFNGYVPQMEEGFVTFRIQGETFLVDATRMPLLFVVKSYSVNPDDWEMDILREAAHRMSDDFVMVKTTLAEDGKSMRCFVAVMDRNVESFRTNLPYYASLIEDGLRHMDELYRQMVEERRDAALAAQPTIPPVQQENKVLS